LRSISSASGINPERGDTISVEPLPFTTELADRKAAAEQAERERQARILYMELAGMLLVLALIAGYLMMRRRKKNQELEAIEAERRRVEAEERRQAAERAALIEAGKVKEEELTEEEQRQLTEKQQLMALIDARPAEVAMLIKTWLAEDE
jgi:flagellar M-ring protein FliF